MVHKQGGMGFSEALADFAQPLIDATDGSGEQVSKAMMLATLCWNLALLDDGEGFGELLEEITQKSREELKLGARETLEFRQMMLDMVERHRRMFPSMHRGRKGSARKGRRKSMRFEKCPVCNATLKSKNMAGHLERVHPRPRIPSAGTLWRFTDTHRGSLREEMLTFAEEVRSSDLDLPQLGEMEGEHERYRRRAEKEGHTSVILEIVKERDRRLAEGKDEKAVSEWAHDMCYHLLLDWKAGLEDYIYGQFFTKERCGSCTREDKGDVLCDEGLADCLFDEEYEMFQREYVNTIIDKLSKGVLTPEEVQVPEETERRATELKRLGEEMRAVLKRRV